MNNDYFDELKLKAKAISDTDKKNIIQSFNKEELFIHIETLYNKMNSDYNSSMNIEDETITLRKIDDIASVSFVILISKGNIRAKTIDDVSKIETMLNNLKRKFDKYIVLVIGDVSNEAITRIESLNVSKIELKDINWLIGKFLEYYPEVFYDPNKISFFHQKITELERMHWLSKRGLNLSDVFTDPIISTIHFNDSTDISFNEIITKRKLPFQFLKSVLNSKDKILLTGEPGSGKTTALAKVVIDSYKACIKQLSNKSLDKIQVPILLKANEFLEISSIESLYTIIPEKNRDSIQIKSLFIDALDEIPIEKREPLINKALEISNTLDISLIISTRTDQISKDSMQSLKKFDLLPFEFNSAFSLVQKIIKENKTTDFLKIKQNIIDSIQRIHKNLPLTPISIILLIELIEQEKEVPASLVELYQRYLDLVLGNMDTKKGLQVLFDYPIKEKFLSSLAYEEFYKKNCLDITKDNLENFIKNYESKFRSIGDTNQFIEEL